MLKPRICIISPGLACANNGNWQTAKRWQKMLSGVYQVDIMLQWDGAAGRSAYDAMLALHTRPRSRPPQPHRRWCA